MSPSSPGRFPRKIRGSVVVQRRRCGKRSCRCAAGKQLHESVVLSYSEGGRDRTVMPAPDELAKVRAAVERYRAARADLEAEGNAGPAALLSRRAGTRRAR